MEQFLLPGVHKVQVGKGDKNNMRIYSKVVVIAAMLFAAVVATNAQVSLGIRIGPPPRERVVRVMPAQPGPEFLWIGGYWYPVGNHYKWHEGYWSRPPYEGARWVAPHHDGQQFFAGYWDGDRGHVEHDHRWDRDHDNRDFGRLRQDDRNNGNNQGHEDDHRSDNDRQ